jgi:hypothetical protein
MLLLLWNRRILNSISPIGFLDRPDFEQNYKRAFEVLVSTVHIFRHLPIFRHLISLMPAIGPYLGPDIAYMVKSMNETVPNHVIKAQQQKSADGPRVFTEIIDSPIPDEHKTVYRLSGEGWSLVAAGSETTAVRCCQWSPTLMGKGIDRYIIGIAKRHYVFPAIAARETRPTQRGA